MAYDVGCGTVASAISAVGFGGGQHCLELRQQPLEAAAGPLDRPGRHRNPRVGHADAPCPITDSCTLTSRNDCPTMLHRTTTLGDFTLHALEAGALKLDGGAMFGVVPKPLWEKRIPADERNRIPMVTRCLLVETPDALVLIDNGVGNKEDAKFLDIYGVQNDATDGSVARLEQCIRASGFAPEDVDVMIDTHLHFDHAGGNTHVDAEGQLRLSFPNARYIVQKGELDWAHRPNERTRASYFDRNYDPVMAAGRLDLVDGIARPLPGIELRPTPGHTPFHQSVVLR